MSSKTPILREAKEWLTTGTINGVEFSAQALIDRIDVVLEDTTDGVSEADVHKAIKPYLTPTLQGKVMGALRQTIDMYDPREPANVAKIKRTGVMSYAEIKAIRQSVENPKTAFPLHCMSLEAWDRLINALERDRAYDLALHYAGLVMIYTQRGYSIKPAFKDVVAG